MFVPFLSSAVIIAVLAPCLALAGEADDPFLWLEEVEGERALAWVEEQNRRSTKVLEAVPEFEPIFERTLEMLDSEERIPAPSLHGRTVYNFWKDGQHERGIWRRTSLASYRTAEPEWETLLDIDALTEADGVPWVFKGASCLPPEHRRCMITLAPGGSDAAVYREFDTVKKAFVGGGFELPEAKSLVDWRDENSLWVGTDFGEGSLTTSGYPRIAKLWRRGTPLAEATTVFEGEPGDVAVMVTSRHTAEGRYDLVGRVPAFYREENLVVLGERLVKLDLPVDAELKGIFKDQVLVALRSDWAVGGTTYPQGALLATDLDDLLRGEGRFDVLFEPTERSSLDGVASTRDRVLVGALDNVRSTLTSLTFAGGEWTRESIPLPGLGTAGVVAVNRQGDELFFSYQDFLTPASLFLAAGGRIDKVKSMPAFFATEGMQVAQHQATSKDGTRVPYFVVTPRGFKADGAAPTLLYGYGGFENSEVPRYSATIGAAWLERGGVLVIANGRGGGEFGPRWHQAALKENRIRSFEDFIAVAEGLIERGITSSRHLGIMGGSQGGLLVAGCMTLRPKLFRAVVSQVPLTDMKRYHTLLAGASWMAEYGNPDLPEEWAFIKTWSPYHLLRKHVSYPEAFFWTTTRDDRVHPGHARKMVARMLEQDHPVLYYENVEGGHGSGSVNRQKAYTTALEFAYLWKMLR